jgi:RHS repeat-associated protein
MAEYVPGPGGREAERWEYVYDGFGRRVRKLHVVEGEVAEYFDYAYDGDQVIAEYSSTAADPQTPMRTLLYGAYIDEPIAMDTASGARYYFVSDGTRSVSLLLGETAPGVWAVVERYAYEDFGEAIVLDAAGLELSASAFGNPYFFQGRRYDAELGLYYYRNRYMSPLLGRFITPDPLGAFGRMSVGQ